MDTPRSGGGRRPVRGRLSAWGALLACALALGVPGGSAPPAPVGAGSPQPGAGSPARYRVADLGTLGGPESNALAINDRGEVVGMADTAKAPPGLSNAPDRPFLWRDGHMQVIPAPLFVAVGVSNSGAVLGMTPDKLSSLQTSVWAGSRTIRVTGPDKSRLTWGWAINARGDVAGFYDGTLGAFLWRDGRFSLLPVPRDCVQSEAHGLNARAWAVGYALFKGSKRARAVLWRGGHMVVLGGLGGALDSVAGAVSGRGVVVGQSQWIALPSGHQRKALAFLWDGGHLRSLGTLPGYRDSDAVAVNDRGEAVGSVTTADGGRSHAVLWVNGRIHDLNDLIPAGSGWTLIDAEGINGSGQIVGQGRHRSAGPFATRAFLLTPVR